MSTNSFAEMKSHDSWAFCIVGMQCATISNSHSMSSLSQFRTHCETAQIRVQLRDAEKPDDFSVRRLANLLWLFDDACKGPRLNTLRTAIPSSSCAFGVSSTSFILCGKTGFHRSHRKQKRFKKVLISFLFLGIPGSREPV